MKTYALGCKRSPYDCRDYKYEKLIKSTVKVPETLDLRDSMFEVKDQGSYGTCSAMTASQIKEWQEIEDVNINENLSPQFVYNLRSNWPEDGMYSRNTMDILVKKGIVEENLYPYAKSFSQDIPKHLLERGLMYNCKGYAAVETVEGLKQALFTNGVCYLAVPVYNYTSRMWYRRTGDALLGGHAMSIVGYTAEGFIIRNSWDDDWNGDGHTIFPYEDWLLKWEVWTSIDEDTLPDPVKKCWFIELLKKIWNWIVNIFRK